MIPDTDLNDLEAIAKEGVSYLKVSPSTIIALVGEVRRLREVQKWGTAIGGFVSRMGFHERSGTELGMLVKKLIEANAALADTATTPEKDGEGE